MTDIIDILQIREPRCQIKSGNDLTVTIASGDPWSESLEAELVNIFTRGARFRARQAFDVKEVIAVRIEVKTPRRTVFISGEVCWVTPGADGNWSFGCSFKPPIPDEVLHEFAVAGIVERREHPRERMSLRTTAKRELSSETITVWVLNYSPGGGLCLLSQSGGMLCERVLLQFETDDGQEILARGTTRWQLESEEGFVIGWEFLTDHDSDRFSALIDSKPRDNEEGNWDRSTPQMLAGVVSDSELPKPQAVWRRLAYIVAISAVMLLCTIMVSTASRPVAEETVTLEPEMSTASVRKPDAEVATTLGDEMPADLSQLGASHRQTCVDENRPVGASPSNTPRSLESQRDTGQAGRTLSLHPLLLPLRTLLSTNKKAVLEWLPWPSRMDNNRRASVVGGEADVAHVPQISLTGQARQLSNSDNTSPTLPPVSTGPIHDKAMAAFRQGRALYNLREYDQAAEALQTAIRYDSANALYVYLLAMAQYQLQRYEQAERSVKEAVELERKQSVPAWGKTMQRYQGRVRIWLENRRSQVRRSGTAAKG